MSDHYQDTHRRLEIRQEIEELESRIASLTEENERRSTVDPDEVKRLYLTDAVFHAQVYMLLRSLTEENERERRHALAADDRSALLVAALVEIDRIKPAGSLRWAQQIARRALRSQPLSPIDPPLAQESPPHFGWEGG
jgi:hypothetical protein